MNLARGLKRVLVVASLIYWGVAATVANGESDRAIRLTREESKGDWVFANVGGGFQIVTLPEGDPETCQRALAYLQESNRADRNGKAVQASGCEDPAAMMRDLERHVGLKAAKQSLLTAGAIYAGFGASVAALWWIIAGFRSPKAKPE